MAGICAGVPGIKLKMAGLMDARGRFILIQVREAEGEFQI